MPTDAKLGIAITYIKRQLLVATQISLIKVKGIVAKIRNLVSAQYI